VGLPLTKEAIHGVFMQDDIHWMNEGLNPNLDTASKIKECLTWSKEFNMSSIIIMPFSMFSLQK
jgi:hypothetical protein